MTVSDVSSVTAALISAPAAVKTPCPRTAIKPEQPAAPTVFSAAAGSGSRPADFFFAWLLGPIGAAVVAVSYVFTLMLFSLSPEAGAKVVATFYSGEQQAATMGRHRRSVCDSND